MRKDIKIGLESGDFSFTVKEESNPQAVFTWGSEDLSGHIGCTVVCPRAQNQTVNYYLEGGIRVDVPYLPKLSGVIVRLVIQGATGSPYDKAFTLRRLDGDGNRPGVTAAAIYSYAPAGKCLLTFDDKKGEAYLWAAGKIDFELAMAGDQNTNMMLKCCPGNNYRYPTVGVGLVRWINGNMGDEALARTLIAEFEADGVRINRASWDSVTEKLILEAETNHID